MVFGGSFNFLGSASRKYLAAIDVSNSKFKIRNWKPDVSNFYIGDIYDILHYKNDIFAGGSFYYDTSTNEYHSGVDMQYLIALNDSTGKISRQFSQYPNSYVKSLSIFNGNLMVAGSFSQFDSVYNHSFIASRYYLASYDLSNNRLSPEVYNPNSIVHMLTDKSGNLITAGDFTLVNFVDRRNLASIDLKTGLPISWNPSPSGGVRALAIKKDSLFLGGNFYHIGSGYQWRENLAAVSTKTGEVFSNWSADVNGDVFTLAADNNTLYVGGTFTSIKNTARNYAAALNTNNAALKSWNPNPDNLVTTILPLNKAVYLGGSFTTIKGNVHPYLARVNNTTGAPSSWRPDPNGTPYSIVSSGKTIFVGGAFQQVGSKARYGLAAFDSATNTLTGFNPKITNSYYPEIYPLAVYGKNLYYGMNDIAQTVGDSARGAIAGINTGTKTALAFNPMPDAPFYSNFSNAFSAGKNKLFAGGYWNSLGKYISPSYFAVFTLEPQQQASGLNFTELKPKSATVNFTTGTGENRLVVIKQGSVPSDPADGQGYIANTAFKYGDSTGSDSYVVYSGNGNSVNITNLSPNRSYTVSVYEYNGKGSASDYLLYPALSGSFTTPSKTMLKECHENAIAVKPASCSIYPNPATSECVVTFTATIMQDYVIDVLDTKGNVLMHNSIRPVKGSNNINLKIDHLPNGTYFVSIISKNGDRENLKLIKQ